MRPLVFVTQNAEKQGDFFNGIASKFQSTCTAADDLPRPLGDPQETSIKVALDFLASRQCTPIGSGGATAQGLSQGSGSKHLLSPARSNTIQQELPGFF